MAVIEQWTEQHTGIEIEAILDAGRRPLLALPHRCGCHEGYHNWRNEAAFSRIKDGAGDVLVPNAAHLHGV
jgi:hypothetical protein